jgi:hypothetical protein
MNRLGLPVIRGFYSSRMMGRPAHLGVEAMQEFKSVEEIAWHVDALFAIPENQERFLSQSQAFLKLHRCERKRPLPLPFPDEYYHDEVPEIQCCEEYAVLAALHRTRCEGRRRIDPKLWSDDPFGFLQAKTLRSKRKLKKEYLRWLDWKNLTDEAAKLTNASLRYVLGCLRSVEADLASIDRQKPAIRGRSRALRISRTITGKARARMPSANSKTST